MIDAVGIWFRKIVIVSLGISVITSLIPESSFKKIAGFAAGLIFFCVALEPICAVDWGDINLDMESYRNEIQTMRDEFDRTNDQEIAAVIAEKTAAYILDKAEEMGVSCSVFVETEKVESGVWLPSAVYLDGSYYADLEAWIEETLGICAKDQHWQTNCEGEE